MNKESFNYSLNAFYFFMCKNMQRFAMRVGKPFDYIFDKFFLLFPKERQQQMRDNYAKSQEEYEEMFSYRGVGANHAKGWFNFYYGTYAFLPAFAVGGIFFRYDIIYVPLIVLIVGLPMFYWFKAARKAVFDDDVYLTYFEMFEKEDAAWEKKWRRRTRLFKLCSLLSIPVSIGLLFLFAFDF